MSRAETRRMYYLARELSEELWGPEMGLAN